MNRLARIFSLVGFLSSRDSSSEDVKVKVSQTSEYEKLKFSAQLEEYKSLSQFYISKVNHSHQVLNYTLIAIGALLAAFKIIVDAKVPVLFLLAALLFYGLFWTHLRYALTIMALCDYIEHKLDGAMVNTMNEVAGYTAEEQPLFGWYAGENETSYTPMWLRPLEAARYIVTLAPATFCFWAYWTYHPRLSWNDWYKDYLLLLVNVILLSYSVIVAAKMRSSLFNKRKERQVPAKN